MNKSLLAAVLLSLPSGAFAAPSPEALEAISRLDYTGQGTYHRIGMLRQQEDTISLLEKISDQLSAQARANTMYFSSDNIFNTENNVEGDAQVAEFLGASLKWSPLEAVTLDTRFDAAYFRHQDRDNRDNDFDTRTFRQQLSYDLSLLDGEAALSIPLSWQHAEVLSVDENDSLARTWTYGTGLEFSWFPSRQLLPTFSYNYFVTDPKQGAGKHKHDFNLGLTYIPLPGTKLFLSPSVQYSHEDFKRRNRTDKAWTPTLSASWQPLRFLAIDAVVSYTDSNSNETAGEFEALTGTLFARLFWKWQ